MVQKMGGLYILIRRDGTMSDRGTPKIFQFLLSELCLPGSDLVQTGDGFFMLKRSVADLLAVKDVFDFPDSTGKRVACSSFFDDWYLYAVPGEEDDTYSLLKLREQEHDAQAGADGDMPGVTISFIAFNCRILLACLAAPTDENRKKLNTEINRVVAYKGQHHHKALKNYFKNPQSQGAYLVADVYTRYIASLAQNHCLEVPVAYKEMAQKSASKNAAKFSRLPRFIDELNQTAGCVVCDHEHIYFANKDEPTAQEAAAILATHTGNTSVYSFAAEVEYHAKFLTPLAKIKIPFFGRSVYDSAIRADMTVGDTEFQGPAPFHHPESKIVKRQYALHRKSHS